MKYGVAMSGMVVTSPRGRSGSAWTFSSNAKLTVTCGNCGEDFKVKVPKGAKTGAQCPHCSALNTDVVGNLVFI